LCTTVQERTFVQVDFAETYLLSDDSDVSIVDGHVFDAQVHLGGRDPGPGATITMVVRGLVHLMSLVFSFTLSRKNHRHVAAVSL